MQDEEATPTLAAVIPAEPDTEATETQDRKTFDEGYVNKLRSQNERYRLEAKAGQEARDKLTAIEQESKTEAERAADRLRDLEARLASSDAEKLRLRVGADKGLSPSLISRLRGETEEELLADADQLLSLIAPPAAPPAPNLMQGQRGEPAPSQLTRDEVVKLSKTDSEALIQAEKDGRLDKIKGLA